MQIQMTARHFDASPALRTRVVNRMKKLERYYDGIVDANVVLTRKPEKGAEISLNVFRQTLTAKTTASSHEDAVDNAVERLRRQLLRYKAKLKSVDRHAHR
jgi:putative sigma-54 modulation protein